MATTISQEMVTLNDARVKYYDWLNLLVGKWGSVRMSSKYNFIAAATFAAAYTRMTT